MYEGHIEVRKRLFLSFDGASIHKVEMTSAQFYSSRVEKLQSCDIYCEDSWRPTGKVMTCLSFGTL